MGNSIRTVGLLRTVEAGQKEPFHYQLGRGFINLSEKEFSVTRSGIWSEKWTMSYNVGLSTSILSLTRSGKDEGATRLHIPFFSATSDSYYGYDLEVETVTESDVLVNPRWVAEASGRGTSKTIERSTQTRAGGSVTETCFCLFRTEDTRSLVVLEMKKRNKEEGPYAVTLAHYFAIIDGSRTETDFGLSVVVKIRATKGNLDVTVEGPEQHPALGLRYLFQETMKTKIWKPTLCPHCANAQNQRSTHSDDSDSARRHGGCQRNLRNSGFFHGNCNANYIENLYFYLFRFQFWKTSS
ncbi:hypothetical protein PHAVU_004G167200 [Phaseolus vulgaris]|uniref:Uncharacterized protein n=1 Tax=Phaseolus vulgaris TaxID=3885 RepID=V7C406_PHAVU|nr:hypothetical protein PHAVU_004G167200g [Phaseolus vulgaris]ESW24864.1 hypothetical protein PHAVU_004G167200g [Phaseolus vulgaris]